MINKKSNSEKVIALLIVLWVAILLLGGCASESKQALHDDSWQAEQMKLQVVVGSGPTAVSMAKMFEETTNLNENVSIEYIVAGGADILTAKVLSGEGDFVMMPSNLAAKLYNQNVPYQVAAANTWGVLYVVSNGIQISDFSDLKGQEIATVAKGATPDIQLRYFLKQSGLNPDTDVKIVYRSSVEELATYMITGKDRLAVMPEPILSNAQNKNDDLEIVLDLQEEWKKIHNSDMAIPQAVLLVKKSLTEEHPEVVASFMEKYQDALIWVNENYERAGELANKHALGIPSEIVSDSIPRCNILYKNALELKPYLEAYLQVLLNFNPETVGGKLPDEGFYYVEK